jgi:hypothetical protein
VRDSWLDAPLVLAVLARRPKRNGAPGAPRSLRLPAAERRRLPTVDRELLALRDVAVLPDFAYAAWDEPYTDLQGHWGVDAAALPRVLELLAATGRVFADGDGDDDGANEGEAEVPRGLRIDATEPFLFELAWQRDHSRRTRLVAQWRRGAEVLPGDEVGPGAIDGVLVHGDRLLRCVAGTARELAKELASGGPLQVKADEVQALLAELATLPGAAQFLLPLLDEVPLGAPTAVVFVGKPARAGEPLPATLRFDYAGTFVAPDDERPVLDVTTRLVRRDAAAERAASERVAAVEPGLATGRVHLAAERLPELAQALLAIEVRVLAEGRRLRPLWQGRAAVRSGVDWFAIDGEFHFDGCDVSLPELLQGKLTPDGFVELADGSLGMLPATWLRRMQALRQLDGDVVDGTVRVPSSRALLLDALLAAQEDATTFTLDAKLSAWRDRLARFAQVLPAQAPAGFAGELRQYQSAGLGWLHFLRDFGLGGCLADDMGLGKTVQVLALLAGEHAAPAKRPRGKRPSSRPSLLVAPRSVLGNWLAEARRFAPGLRVLDFSGAGRWRDGTAERIADHDLVLSTYALVRADAPQFVERGLQFHWAVLDEAQAIKNADSLGSKAVRLLRATHRLVLTGTPVENHLGDLWSLFEFLNPGMLGRLPAFRAWFGKDLGAIELRQQQALVQRALRPVLLRRTKAQVLPELPTKVEQTLWCTMAPAQHKRYHGLQAHYRQQLLAGGGAIDGKQRFVVLEALLRLRQAATHEGLLERRFQAAESAKFEVLLPRLEELAAEGHKALVFSQFTSLLDLLEPELATRGMVFERLDGSTKRRTERIERFQTDPDCKVFLISLKAGGYGLNLTAASYVFLLDPWWNPAVEMQAIDRAHRLGQQRTVNAYRLVCRGTVEERVLELQESKRALCEAILGNERSLLQDLTRADLELLLGGGEMA